jgi:hypothetical protein
LFIQKIIFGMENNLDQFNTVLTKVFLPKYNFISKIEITRPYSSNHHMIMVLCLINLDEKPSLYVMRIMMNEIRSIFNMMGFDDLFVAPNFKYIPPSHFDCPDEI